MAKLNWEYTEGKYTITSEHGKAVITEEILNRQYAPRIFDSNGEPVGSYIFFDDLETAQEVAVAQLITLDETRMSGDAFKQLLADTIDSIKPMFASKPLSHQLRLQNIRNWILDHHSPQQLTHSDITDWDVFEFEWQGDDKGFFVDTKFGRVRIHENKPSGFAIGSASRHSITLTDNAGTILRDHMPPAYDFKESERRVREILNDLEYPLIEETHIDYVEFVMNICQDVLPDETDSMILVRLEHIKGWILEVLP